MIKVEMEEREWQSLMSVLANSNAPWVVVNPLMMKLASQVRMQVQPEMTGDPPTAPPLGRRKANSNDISPKP